MSSENRSESEESRIIAETAGKIVREVAAEATRVTGVTFESFVRFQSSQRAANQHRGGTGPVRR